MTLSPGFALQNGGQWGISSFLAAVSSGVGLLPAVQLEEPWWAPLHSILGGGGHLALRFID